MLFTGGACTEGPGMIVGQQLKEAIRSHHDIDRETVKHFKRATKVGGIAYLFVSEDEAYRRFSSMKVLQNELPTTVMQLIFLLVAWIKLAFWK